MYVTVHGADPIVLGVTVVEEAWATADGQLALRQKKNLHAESLEFLIPLLLSKLFPGLDTSQIRLYSHKTIV